MLPIFNEHRHATNMNNGTSRDRDREDKRVYTFKDLLIYTKWLRWNLWGSESNEEEVDKKVHNGLITFCEQLQMYFNLDTDYAKINAILAQSKKYKLRQCNPSYITVNEWSQIMAIPDENTRRTYFALLVLGKFNRTNPVLLASDTKNYKYEDKRFRISLQLHDIYKYAGVKFKRNELKDNPRLFYEPILLLQDLGYIENRFYRNKCTIIVNNADIDVDPEDVYIKISEYDDIDSYYKYGMHELKYKVCPKCGIAFKGNRQNNDKYCKKCTEKDDTSYHYIHCVDCGSRVKISNKDHKTIRCKDCQHEHIKEYDKTRKSV